MTLWIGNQDWQPTVVIDPWVGDDDGTSRQVQKIWVGDSAGKPRLVFARAVPVELTATSLSWNSIRLDWTPVTTLGGAGYVVKRNGVQIYQGTALTFTDTGLAADTSYTYSIDAYIGQTINSSATATARTSASIPITLTATVVGWDRVDLSWTAVGPGAQYTVTRNGSAIYSLGTGLSTSSAGLLPSTSYTYVVTATLGGVQQSTASQTVATPAHALSASIAAVNYGTVRVSWVDNDQRSISHYGLWLDNVWQGYVTGNYRSWDFGVGESSSHHAHVIGHRTPGQDIQPQVWTGWATTPARPKTYATAWGGSASGATGWTQSTRRYLTGNDVHIVANGSTITSLDMLVYGRGTARARIEPFVGGTSAGYGFIVDAGRKFNRFHVNIGRNAGTCSTGCNTGGSAADTGGWGVAEWSPWSPQRWDYYVCTDRVDYWYWSSLFDDEQARAYPWWTPELTERDINLETWHEPVGGAITRVRATDRATGEVLVEWEG